MTRPAPHPPLRKDLPMTSRPLARRSLFAGSGALLVGGVLSACASEPEAPPAPPAGPEIAEPTPAQTTEQLDAVVAENSTAVTAADEARDPAQLAPRVIGSAVEFRTATYALIAKAEEWTAQLTVPGAALVVPMSTTGTDFPRTAIGLVENSAADGVPFFLALQQADARSPYTTWGWAQQAVDVAMPTVADAAVGSEAVAIDAADLVMTPAEALALYATVLTDGDAKDPEDQLAVDPFITSRHSEIQEERKALNAGVEWDEGATIRETYAVREDEFAGLRTDDGGALVMGTLTSTRKVTIKDGATMRYAEDNAYTKVVGTREFTKEFVRTFGTHVALYIPSAEAGGQVQPVGATLTALTATGS